MRDPEVCTVNGPHRVADLRAASATFAPDHPPTDAAIQYLPPFPDGDSAALSASDISTLLGTISELAAVRPLQEFRRDTVEIVPTLVACTLVSWNELDLSQPNAEFEAILHPDPLLTLDPQRQAVLNTAFAAHIGEHPVIRYFQETGDGRPRTISDFWPEETFHRMPLYRDFYSQPEVATEDQLSITLPHSEAVIGLALSRPRRDFTERDRTVLNLLRPHLVQAHRNGAAFDRMRWLIAGLEHGMVGDTEGLVLLSQRGVVEHVTPRARELLSRYFPDAPRTGIPINLREWISRCVASATPPWPFVRDRHGGRLFVRTLPGPGGMALLMAERGPDEPPAPLRRLGLTERQVEVMSLVAEAMSTKQIALRLAISPRTVDKHIEGALRALGTDSRLAAANLIRQAGHPGPVNP